MYCTLNAGIATILDVRTPYKVMSRLTASLLQTMVRDILNMSQYAGTSNGALRRGKNCCSTPA